MKKIFVTLVSFVVIGSLVAFNTISNRSDDVNYTVDVKNSKVEFSGSKKNGYHPGIFMLKDGMLKVNEGKIIGGNFNIDIAGLKVTDAAGEKLEGHLKTADFFDVAKFPDANFEITAVKYSDANTAQISGNLTLKGAKAEVSFEAKIRSIGETKLFAQAFFTLDRTKLGVMYGIGNVSNDVQIAVHLFATK